MHLTFSKCPKFAFSGFTIWKNIAHTTIMFGLKISVSDIFALSSIYYLYVHCTMWACTLSKIGKALTVEDIYLHWTLQCCWRASDSIIHFIIFFINIYFQKAFDTIDHYLLLKQNLWLNYGFLILIFQIGDSMLWIFNLLDILLTQVFHRVQT